MVGILTVLREMLSPPKDCAVPDDRRLHRQQMYFSYSGAFVWGSVIPRIVRDLNPGPSAPEARIVTLDQRGGG